MKVFSTDQIASGLGRSYEAVRKRLVDTPCTQRVISGNVTRAYEWRDLPLDYRQGLDKNRERFGFRDVESLLSQGKPAEAVNGLEACSARSKDLDEAAKLMRAMRRALELEGRASAFEQEQAGLDDYKREFGHRPSDKTWWKKFRDVLKRDGGQSEWNRIELYLSDAALSWMNAHGPKQVAAEAVQDVCKHEAKTLQDAYSAVEKPSLPSEKEKSVVWHCGFLDFDALQLAGKTKRHARAAIQAKMEANPVRLCLTRKAYRQAWDRNYRRWVSGGRKSIALNDARHGNPGRAPIVALNRKERGIVQAKALQIDTNLSDHSARSLPLRLLAEDERCRPEVAEVIQANRASKHSQTPKLRQQARVTPEAKMMARGPRCFKTKGYKQLRSNTYVDEHGEEKSLLPGMLFESDDMHLNEGFYIDWPEENTADKCVQKFGVRPVRAQLLPVIDVATRRWLSLGFALRPNDAYRGSDIVWTFGHVFREIGIPTEGARLERGIWEANKVQALEACTKIYRAHSPGSKVIENRFGMLQKYLASKGMTLGRGRGEFEEAGKRWKLARDGKMHPAQAGFLSWEQVKENLRWAMSRMNTDRMEGAVKGMPDDLWNEHFLTQPALSKPTGEQLVCLLPERRTVAIRDGMVNLRSKEHEGGYQFRSAELAKLGRGYRVEVVFDPLKLSDGAFILNAETRERAALKEDGVTSYREGELICRAEFEDRSPQFSKVGTDYESFLNRNEFTREIKNQCIRYFETIKPRGTSQESTARAIEINRGQGEIERVTQSGSSIERASVGTVDRQQLQAARKLRSMSAVNAPGGPVYKLKTPETIHLKNPRKQEAALKEHLQLMDKLRPTYANQESVNE